MSSYRESATPIFDEVDRRWRKTEVADDDAGAPPSMLSFAGTPATATPDGANPDSAAPGTPTTGGRRAHAAPAPDGTSPTVLSLITAARRESGPRHALRR